MEKPIVLTGAPSEIEHDCACPGWENRPSPPCEFCGAAATGHCEDCGAPICNAHTVTIRVRAKGEAKPYEVRLCPQRLK